MKIKLLLSLLVIFICSCVSSFPDLMQFPSGEGTMYFFPPTNWKSKSDISLAKLDITYHSGRDLPAAVNISFFGKKSLPHKVTSAVLNGDGIEYPLSNFKTLYANRKKKELRISTEGNRNLLPDFLKAQPITLTAEIDGVQYTFTPDKNFTILIDDFLVIF